MGAMGGLLRLLLKRAILVLERFTALRPLPLFCVSFRFSPLAGLLGLGKWAYK